LPVAHHLDLASALVSASPFVPLGTTRRAQRRRRSVLRLAHRDEAQHGVHQLQVPADLLERLGGRPVLEQHVERPSLLGHQVREVTQAPFLYLADRAALLLDERTDTRRELLRTRLALLRMDQDERLIAAIRHALPPVD